MANTYETDDFLNTYLPSETEKTSSLKHHILLCNNDPGLIESILILGPTGVGKSRLAKIITAHRCWVQFHKTHQIKGEHIKAQEWDRMSHKWLESGFDSILNDFAQPWDSLSISNIEGDTFESELFGHEKGAFTDAKTKKIGRLARENLLDVLIDEIANASIITQQKLLQVLQDKTFTPKGGKEKLPCTARFLFATNRSLNKMLRDGTLQLDFFFRLLNGGIIELLPLRNRVDEIEDILDSILDDLRRKLPEVDPRKDISISAADIAFAKSYPWPGNIRELEAALRNWLVARRWTPEVRLEEIALRNSHLYKEFQQPDDSDPLAKTLNTYFGQRIARAIKGDKLPGLSEEVRKLTIAAQRTLADRLSSSGYTKSITALAQLMDQPTEQDLQSAREWISKHKSKAIAKSDNPIAISGNLAANTRTEENS